MHHAAAAAEQQRELAGQLLLPPHRQLGAVRRDIADDAAGQRRFSIEIDMRGVVHLVADTLAQLAESIDDTLAIEVLKDIADEERVHAGEFLRLLRHLAPEEEKLYAEGAEEVEEFIQKLKKE